MAAVSGLGLPLCAVLAVAGAHLVLHHITGRRSLIRTFIAAWGFGVVGLTLARLALSFPGDLSFDLLAHWVTDLGMMSGFSYAYMDFLCYGEASIRVRILAEIERGPPRGLTLEEILSRYNARVIADLRVGRLLASGQMTTRDDRAFLRSRFAGQLLLAKVYLGLRRVLFGQTAAPIIRDRPAHRSSEEERRA